MDVNRILNCTCLLSDCTKPSALLNNFFRCQVNNTMLNSWLFSSKTQKMTTQTLLRTSQYTTSITSLQQHKCTIYLDIVKLSQWKVTLKSPNKRTNAPSQSVDQWGSKLLGSLTWLESVHCVSFSALTLLVEMVKWQEWHQVIFLDKC